MRYGWICVGLLVLGACSPAYLDRRAAHYDLKAQNLRAKASNRNLAQQEKMARLPSVPEHL
jgi:hypothetical protein